MAILSGGLAALMPVDPDREMPGHTLLAPEDSGVTAVQPVAPEAAGRRRAAIDLGPRHNNAENNPGGGVEFEQRPLPCHLHLGSTGVPGRPGSKTIG